MTAELNDKLYYGSTELAEVQNMTFQSIYKMSYTGIKDKIVKLLNC